LRCNKSRNVNPTLTTPLIAACQTRSCV